MSFLRSIITVISVLLIGTVHAQFYYKDLVVTKQSSQQMKQFKAEKVKAVKLVSFESSGNPTEDFMGEQLVTNDFTVLKTLTKSKVSDSSELTTIYNANAQLVKTIDTTDGYKSTSEYRYNGDKLSSITNYSSSTGQAVEKEEHIWIYTAEGRPEKMYKIKNDKDTTYITFVADEKGNIIEEHSVRNKKTLPTYYYYYDDKNRLTDIVRYNAQARRLLPDYIFEYDDEGRVFTVVIVPEDSSNYEKWFYSYYDNGLKGQEACYNKKQELQGRIEYKYSF